MRLLVILLFAFGYCSEIESSHAMSQTIDRFSPITIGRAPPEIAAEIKNAQIASGNDYRLKMSGLSSDAGGFDLVVVRTESKDGCDNQFCPTYIKYSFKEDPTSVQRLILKCDERLLIGDN